MSASPCLLHHVYLTVTDYFTSGHTWADERDRMADSPLQAGWKPWDEAVSSQVGVLAQNATFGAKSGDRGAASNGMAMGVACRIDAIYRIGTEPLWFVAWTPR